MEDRQKNMGIRQSCMCFPYRATARSAGHENDATTQALLSVPSSPPRRHSPCDAPLATKVQDDTSIWLPYDLISEILPLLPVKSLCRFRCVSREWRTLISHPAFVSKHRSHAEPLILAYSFREFTLRLFDMDGEVVRAIRGVDWFSKSICTSADDLACVVNEFGTVRVIDLATGKVFVTCSGNATTLGFGRAVPSGAYKLVSMTNHRCKILTLGDHVGWRRMLSPSAIIFCYTNTITINGVMYMFVQEPNDREFIRCFDLETEEWRKEINCPPKFQNKFRNVSLGELNGALCACTKGTYIEYRDWAIWLIADSDNSIWVKAYSISFRESTYSRLTPLKVLQESETLLFCGTLLNGGGPILQIYDPSDGTCTTVARMPDDCAPNISLCSLNLERFVRGNI